MRLCPPGSPIRTLWDAGGPFIGENRPHGRVTVEPSWWLRQTRTKAHRGPLRWWLEPGAEQIELPNVTSIQINRSLDQDAATCTIRLANTDAGLPEPEHAGQGFGRRGLLTPWRGVSAEAQSRWGQAGQRNRTRYFHPRTDSGAYYGAWNPDDASSPRGLHGGDVWRNTGGNKRNDPHPFYLFISGRFRQDSFLQCINGTQPRSRPAMILIRGNKDPISTSRPVRAVTVRAHVQNDGKRDAVFQPLLYINGVRYGGVQTHVSGMRTREEIINTRWEVNPGTGDPWTLTDVNRLITGTTDGTTNGGWRWGLQAWWRNQKPGEVKVFAIWVEVTFGPAFGEWSEVLMPNALLRTFQGFGGHDLSIEAAVEAGHLLQTGVWLIDRVQVATDGSLTLECRDLAKLLVEQRVYPPLVPHRLYPLRYSRWSWDDDARGSLPPGGQYTAGDVMPSGLGYYLTEHRGLRDPDPDPNPPPYPMNWLTYGNGNPTLTKHPSATHDGLLGGSFACSLAHRYRGGQGFWLLYRNGVIHPFGAAPWLGFPADSEHAFTGEEASGYWAIESTADGTGFYVLSSDGYIHAFGASAVSALGGTKVRIGTPPGGDYFRALTVRRTAGSSPQDTGFWAMTRKGKLYRRRVTGEPVMYLPPSQFAYSGIPAADIAAPPGYNGFYVLYADGRIRAVNLPRRHVGEPKRVTDVERPHAVCLMVRQDPPFDDPGYWVLFSNGNVEAFGTARYLGSPDRAWRVAVQKQGNTLDYSWIVKDLLCWSGFWWKGQYDAAPSLPGEDERPKVWGTVERTGAWPENPINEEVFDKQPIANAITQIKEIVGFVTYVDGMGKFHFHAPNIWKRGNVISETGVRVSYVPVLDERRNLTRYTVTVSDQDVRSEIFISTSKLSPSLQDTVVSRFLPPNAPMLRGILKPAGWIEGKIDRKSEQQVLAELIALNTWLAQHTAQLTAVAHPALEVNDQVRIYERQSSETWVHYVRSVNTTMDLRSGSYTMDLVTHWLGDDTDWAILFPHLDATPRTPHFTVSPTTYEKGVELGWFDELPGGEYGED